MRLQGKVVTSAFARYKKEGTSSIASWVHGKKKVGGCNSMLGCAGGILSVSERSRNKKIPRPTLRRPMRGVGKRGRGERLNERAYRTGNRWAHLLYTLKIAEEARENHYN